MRVYRCGWLGCSRRLWTWSSRRRVAGAASRPRPSPSPSGPSSSHTTSSCSSPGRPSYRPYSSHSSSRYSDRWASIHGLAVHAPGQLYSCRRKNAYNQIFFPPYITYNVILEVPLGSSYIPYALFRSAARPFPFSFYQCRSRLTLSMALS